MKKILLVLISILCITLSNAQTTIKYTEFNVGASVGVVPMFPGFSFLYGATTKYDSGVILDYQGGLAFPSLVTGKAGIGFSIDPKLDLTFGVRVWPSSTYVQLKINRPDRPRDIVFTVENTWWGPTSLGQGAIFTVGWRPNICNQ